MSARVALVTIVAVLAQLPMRSQERFSFFHASSPEVVERMLKMASLGDNDVVVDLGSGNGLIPITAAHMNPKVRGRGVDIDPNLVQQSNERARSEGVADRVKFEHVNAFDADLRDATVVTMWMFPELMRLLRPIILERAAPGTRVLTNSWDLGSWKADVVDNDGTAIYMWIVPARVAGAWEWELSIAGKPFRYSTFVEQHFQTVEGVARAGDRREVLEGMTVRGVDVAFGLSITLDGLGLTRHDFSGKVENDEIAGTVNVTPGGQSQVTIPWRARRSARSDYFAHTGTSMFQGQPEQVP